VEVFAAAPRRSVVRTVLRSPYVPIGDDFAAFGESLSRRLRKEIRRLERRAADAGHVEYEFATGTERLDEQLDEGFAIEGSGWKSESGSAIVSSPETHRFYRDVARWAAARGSLVLAFMRLDGRAVAFDMCFEEAGVAYVLKGGFDTAHRKLGPGTLLTHASIARAFERGLRSYELLGEADDYKLQWTSELRERVRVQLFAASPGGLARRLAWTHGRRAVARLRERG
jgi:CelD/BcsL family acetyltransferase involved in cellulose biosynthesis